MRLGRLLLRATVGGFFIGHGTQKLFGFFGGQGLQATADSFEAMGLKPGKLNAAASGAVETLGGAGILLGYQTPVAAAALVANMATAIDRVHLKNGPWAANGGYEYNTVLAAASVALAESGPGSLSLDALRGKQRQGGQWSLFALGAGLAAAAGVRFVTEMRAGSQTPAPFDAPLAPEPDAISEPDAHEPNADEGGSPVDEVVAVEIEQVDGEQVDGEQVDGEVTDAEPAVTDEA